MKIQPEVRLKGDISLKDERDDFGDNPVPYNRKFRTTKATQVKVLEETPLIKARSDHAPYSRRKPVRFNDLPEPAPLEESQSAPAVQEPPQITLPQEPIVAPAEPPKPKVSKKVLRFTKSVRPPRETLDHRRLPGS